MNVAVVFLAGMLVAAAPASRAVAAKNKPSASDPCVDYRQADTRVGESGCVSGTVLQVYTSRRNNIFLDFCSDYRTCPFSGVIFASDSGKFADVGTLIGKRVEIHGFIKLYQGRAEIIIHEPRQIRRAP